MSSTARNANRAANAMSRPYVAPTPERKLEKKLAAVEKGSLLLTEKPVVGLETRVNEKELGKGSMILHIGQTDGLTAQMAICRPIGDVPDALASDWTFIPKAQIGNLLGQKNPFEGKTQQRVTQLKVEHGLKVGVLMKNANGEICYPDGAIREKVLADCRVLHDIHASVDGGKPMKPIFSYATAAHAMAEVAYLNSLATSDELKVAIDTETAPYREHETKDPVTGQKQVTMSWARGIPYEVLPTVLMDVIHTGSYNASKWDALKVEAPKKASPFAIWGYGEGSVPPDKLAALTEKLREYAKIRKDYNLSVPQGQKAVREETAEQKRQRLDKHQELQKATRDVNAIERFEYKAFIPFEPKTGGSRPSATALKK